MGTWGKEAAALKAAAAAAAGRHLTASPAIGLAPTYKG